jgi:rod shape-determining protein MreD
MKTIFRILNFVILLICILLQLAFFENFKLINISIDIVLVAIIGITIFDGEIYGLIYGFIAGLLLDLMVGSIIGVSGLLYALNAFIVSRIIGIGFKRNTLTNMLLVLLVTELNLLFVSGIYYLFNFNANPVELGFEMLVNPVFNILAMFVLFPVLSVGRERKEEIGFIFKDKA